MKVPENTGWGTELRALRRSRGLSLAELGRRINLDYSYLARIERGERPPSQALAEACDRVLRGHSQLIQRYLVLTSTVAQIPEPALPMPGRVPGEAEIADAFAMVPEFGMPIIAAGAAGKVTRAHVATLRRQVDQITTFDQHRGSAHVVAAAVRGYRRGRWMLDSGEYTSEIGAELAAAVGDIAECAGWLAYDNNRHQLARRLYTEALALADFSGDTLLQVRVLASMTRQSCHLVPAAGIGMARDALRFSRRACDISRGAKANAWVRALVYAREATAHAALGDGPSFERAIATSWRAAHSRGGRDGEEDQRPWFLFVCESGILAHEAKGRKYLGQPDRAARLFENVIREGGLLRREETSCGAHLASTLATMGETEQAISQGLAVLQDLQTVVHSPRVVHDLGPVSAAAKLHPRIAQANEFQRQFVSGKVPVSAELKAHQQSLQR